MHPKHKIPARSGTDENLFPRRAAQEKAGMGEGGGTGESG